ncbi:MAG: DUF2867 domain-containing protein [Gemmatimonadaceae bacterium]
MRASPAEYLTLPLRAHELMRDVPLYDVSTVDLPGGGAGRTIADVRAIEASAKPSRVANALYEIRCFLGRVFSWDDVQMRPEDSLASRLTERDRRDSEVAPGTADGSFRVLYQFPREALSEIRNATVQGYVCLALSPTASGYRLFFAVYVRRVSWVSRPYLIMIEPFRRFLLYPAMFRRIRRAWLTKYGQSFA